MLQIMIIEMEEFEQRYIKENDGKEPTMLERQEFMIK